MTLRGRLFSGSTLEIAERLIGARLVHDSDEGRTVGRIVETEAYLAVGDPASHSANGRTARNASMFLAAGHAYVYQIYGMHLCFNVVTSEAGVGEAVLVRALEPLEGLELMCARRERSHALELCSGPAKLVQAMGLRRDADGTNLARGPLRLRAPEASWDRPAIVRGPRVGISKGMKLPYRLRAREGGWCS
ncbi:MAG: DNA-3-methyladenine glycosylase [bacterium]|nr:DNA-3-methyladenine glycosylase [bacterium]